MHHSFSQNTGFYIHRLATYIKPVDLYTMNRLEMVYISIWKGIQETEQKYLANLRASLFPFICVYAYYSKKTLKVAMDFIFVTSSKSYFICIWKYNVEYFEEGGVT